ncbi:MAG: hypothetical protein ACR2KK_15455 [Acidimicrobiales bacterium]
MALRARRTALLIALLVALVLAGCGSDGKPAAQVDPADPSTSTPLGPDQGGVSTTDASGGTTTTNDTETTRSTVRGSATTVTTAVDVRRSTTLITPSPIAPTTSTTVVRPGAAVGTITVENQLVSLDGKRTSSGSRVRSGVLVSTDENGVGTVKFDDDAAKCQVRQLTEVRITTRTAALESGRLYCERRGGGASVKILLGSATVVLVDADVHASVIDGQGSVRVDRGSVLVQSIGRPSRFIDRSDGETAV